MAEKPSQEVIMCARHITFCGGFSAINTIGQYIHSILQTKSVREEVKTKT